MKTYGPYSPDFDPDNEQFVRDIMSSFLLFNWLG